MKTHKVLLPALIVSAILTVSAEAGDRHGNNGGSQAAPARGRSSGQSFSSGSGFRYGGARTFGPSQRFSSTGVRSLPSFRQRATFNSSGNVASFSQRRFTPETFNRINGSARFQNNGSFGAIQSNHVNRFGNNDRGFNRAGASNNHVFAQRSADWHRDWDRHHDHWWNGHRCRFVNGSWFIFDFGFVPWYGWSYYDYYYPYGYGGYGYGAYGYDPGVYGQSNYYDQGGYNYNDQSNYYDQGDSNSYNQGGNRSSSYAVIVADVQDQLARAGYYRGQIDGVLGPETRHALVRYQSHKGLHVTGSLTTETQQSLGLAQGAEN